MKMFVRPRPVGPRIIEMTPDGRFVDPPRVPIAAKVFRAAVLVAVIAGGLLLAVVFAWFAALLLPVALAAGAVAWGAWRWQVWQAGK